MALPNKKIICVHESVNERRQCTSSKVHCTHPGQACRAARCTSAVHDPGCSDTSEILVYVCRIDASTLLSTLHSLRCHIGDRGGHSVAAQDWLIVGGL